MLPLYKNKTCLQDFLVVLICVAYVNLYLNTVFEDIDTGKESCKLEPPNLGAAEQAVNYGWKSPEVPQCYYWKKVTN